MLKNFNSFINESIDSIDAAHKALEHFVKSFDINSIPERVRKTLYVDYSEIDDFLNKTSEFRNVDENFNESVTSDDTDVTSIKNVVDGLINEYHLDRYFSIKVYDEYNVEVVNVDKIPQYSQTSSAILVPMIEKNLDIIKKELDKGGYYQVAKHDYKDAEGRQWSFIVFDPKEQKSITEQIKSQYEYLYHCSLSTNDDSIKKNGIIPQNSKNFYNFKEKRVYLHYLTPNNQEFKNMMKKFIDSRKRKEPNFNHKMNVYTISIDDLPKDIEFFQDPHAQAIYTLSSIPTKAIIKTREITF